MSAPVVTVDRVKIRRSFTPGYRPGMNGSRSLEEGEEFINYADEVRCIGTGEGAFKELPLTVAGVIAPTRADLVAGTYKIAAPQAAIRTSGYAAPNDGGGALYARRSTEPAHPGKFQAGGSWWEIVPEDGLDIRQFGAKPLTSVVLPLDETNMAVNGVAIHAARDCAKAFNYCPIHVRGRYIHDNELLFVGDHKLRGDGPNNHAWAVSQFRDTGPSALFYRGSGTQITFDNPGVLGEPVIHGAEFTGIELISIYGSACGLRVKTAYYSKFHVYASGFDVAVDLGFTQYPGGVNNVENGGEGDLVAHCDVYVLAQLSKTALKLSGSPDPARANICKNRIRVHSSYGDYDAVICGNSDTNDFEEVYLYKEMPTYVRPINTTAGSNVVTVGTNQDLVVGMYVFSDDIPSGSRIKAINGVTITLERDGVEAKAQARKTRTTMMAGWSTGAGRGVVLQGGSAYGSSARSNVFSGVLEPGEGGVHILGTEHYPVASQNHEICAWNFENNSFSSSGVVNVGAGGSVTVSKTNGAKRWTNVEFVPTGPSSGEFRLNGVKVLGLDSDGKVSVPALKVANGEIGPGAIRGMYLDGSDMALLVPDGAGGLYVQGPGGGATWAVLKAGGLDVNGNLTASPAASATPANNGEMTFELTSNTSLKIKVKGSDGTVRAATLTLA